MCAAVYICAHVPVGLYPSLCMITKPLRSTQQPLKSLGPDVALTALAAPCSLMFSDSE